MEKIIIDFAQFLAATDSEEREKITSIDSYLITVQHKYSL